MRPILAGLIVLVSSPLWAQTAVKSAAQPAASAPAAAVPAAPAAAQPAPAQPAANDPNVVLLAAYKKATLIYKDKDYSKARDILKVVAERSTNTELSANSLYLLTDCYVRLGEYDNAVMSINLLTKKCSQASIVKNGYVAKFAVNIIDKLTQVSTNWDYKRYQDGTDDNNKPAYKESVPPGKKITRINFKMAFGMFRALKQSSPNSPETLEAKRKLETLLSQPITFVWVDEKARLSRWGHPEDFHSKLALKEKKYFSQIICDRMFYEWKTDKLHEHMVMFDDVRNLKHHYTSRGLAAQGTFTLAKLFTSAAYDPYTDVTANPAEANPGAELGL